ncbi:hypothetical protein JX265_010863 [Neoarthrinium moseri]|uniref:Uncharacterized protein n=1 Tax=Neoarthrinium moseri TaxID=1658444 RepID=A0A9Q0AL59_9PEZI|nr:hypothetical protein JX265_010863 [Neoarthrinium moseri]
MEKLNKMAAELDEEITRDLVNVLVKAKKLDEIWGGAHQQYQNALDTVARLAPADSEPTNWIIPYGQVCLAVNFLCGLVLVDSQSLVGVDIEVRDQICEDE